jgi:toxin ParE1/3/4
MKRREVVFAPEAREDVLALFDWIAAGVGADAALKYVERFERYCFIVRACVGTGRKGLRIVGFERRIAIAFTVDEGRVTLLRVFRRGRDWESLIG